MAMGVCRKSVPGSGRMAVENQLCSRSRASARPQEDYEILRPQTRDHEKGEGE